jgi:hypothetical protein
VVTRVAAVEARPLDSRLLPGPNRPLYHLFHFAKASGHGMRYTSRGCLAPGSAFDLHTVERRPCPDLLCPDLLPALTAFRWLGSVGLRQTRGLGALADTGEVLAFAEFATWAAALAPRVEVCWAMGPDDSPILGGEWRAALEVLESCLRALRQRFPEKAGPSPLGHSGPRERQSSGVHLRPVRLREGVLPVVLYAEAALAPESRRSGFRLAGFRFAHPWGKEAPADHGLTGR